MVRLEKGLDKKLIPLFADFIGMSVKDVKCTTVIEHNKKNNRTLEAIQLAEKENYLCAFTITRVYANNEEDGADNRINMTLKWSDWCEKLAYTYDYYPDMTNESIIKKAKILMTAAKKIFNVRPQRN